MRVSRTHLLEEGFDVADGLRETESPPFITQRQPLSRLRAASFGWEQANPHLHYCNIWTKLMDRQSNEGLIE
ncbi:unnamed protein product [Linum trigynum]|uniref:Uncharacterized protein n=1 Tax=Linum trigynum TaxID=586398 RepID=A0AAV2E5S3_9ROSI